MNNPLDSNVLSSEPRRLAELSDGPVTRFLFSEAGPVYLTLLYALLVSRRRHELAPLHADLYDAVHSAIAELTIDGEYSLDAFALDLNQLAQWGCVRKEVEVMRVRGYRDRSRENFRYSLTEDAVSFLEWL